MLSKVATRFPKQLSLAVLLLAVGLVSAASADAATKTVSYGKYTIPAASGSEMGELKNGIKLGVRAPCSNCFITSAQAKLVTSRGKTANVYNGLELHHMVLLAPSRPDATCAGTPLGSLGERFFASGNERTPMLLPTGYGYQLGGSEHWNLIYDLMNMNSQPEKVTLKVTFTYQPASAGLKPVRPVWLDINECGTSEYSIPSGLSDTHWDWTVNVPGHIVAIAGHIHTEGHGVRIEATDETTSTPICNSVATYGGTPEYIDMEGNPYISSMSGCLGDPVATVASGDVVRLHSIYENPGPPTSGVMGIMIAYIHQH